MKIKPRKLKAGSTIGLVAPSGAFVKTKFRRGCDYLQSKGYRLVVGKHSHCKYGYMAGKDDERASDINAMFADDSVDAIMCIRGGYGSSRILDRIDYDLIRRKPKIFVGFSDPTALQLAIFKKSGVVTFYGPMLSFDFGDAVSQYTWESMYGVLSNAKPYGTIKFPPSGAEYFKVINPGDTRGELLGGCITLIQTLIGTDYMPDLSGKILFLEDAGELPYRLDRVLFHLKNAGVFRGLSGVIIGNTDIPRQVLRRDLTIAQILRDVFKDYDYPVIYDLPFGHCRDKITLPQGVSAFVSTSDRILSLEESGVVE